ncbi:MAG: hypothetical protein RIM80_09820, partial [Alphaproteobacteria bacterium]
MTETPMHGRIEDRRFLTGEGRYTADLARAGQTWGVVVRSPYAHAEIREIDAVDARSAPGVVGVFTADDLAADGVG